MSQLFELLLAMYGLFKRKVYCDASGTRSFRIDDQDASDNDNGFCQLSVRCDLDDGLSIELNACPMDDAVREFVEASEGCIHETPNGSVVTWPIPTKRGPQHVKQLALLIRRIVGRGRTYSDRNLKWRCPRAADSLEQLADAITSLERQHPLVRVPN